MLGSSFRRWRSQRQRVCSVGYPTGSILAHANVSAPLEGHSSGALHSLNSPSTPSRPSTPKSTAAAGMCRLPGRWRDLLAPSPADTLTDALLYSPFLFRLSGSPTSNLLAFSPSRLLVFSSRSSSAIFVVPVPSPIPILNLILILNLIPTPVHLPRPVSIACFRNQPFQTSSRGCDVISPTGVGVAVGPIYPRRCRTERGGGVENCSFGLVSGIQDRPLIDVGHPRKLADDVLPSNMGTGRLISTWSCRCHHLCNRLAQQSSGFEDRVRH